MKVICFIVSFIIFYSCKVVDNSSFNTAVEKIENKANTSEAAIKVFDESPILIYDSHSRGYYYVLTVYETYVTILNNPNESLIKINISENDIKELKSIISKISIDDFLSFKAPTEKRFYDGAPHTVLSISKNKEMYNSQTFDGGFPPKGLEILVNKVLSLHSEK